MKFDWKKILSPDEKIQKEFGISKIYYNTILALSLILAAITVTASLFAGVLLALLGLVYWFYLKSAKHYAFTNKRIVLVDAFAGMSANSIDYNQITDIQFEQSFAEQILGIGTFNINTAGTHSPLTSLTFIDNPQNLKQKLDQIRGSAIKG
jgi:uncharacterized membrane protein YdbT with pleckstrin-like domain